MPWATAKCAAVQDWPGLMDLMTHRQGTMDSDGLYGKGCD